MSFYFTGDTLCYRSIKILQIVIANFVQPPHVLVFYPGIKIKSFCQAIEVMVKGVKTRFVYHCSTKIYHHGLLLIIHQQVFFLFQIHMRYIPGVQLFDSRQ